MRPRLHETGLHRHVINLSYFTRIADPTVGYLELADFVELIIH